MRNKSKIEKSIVTLRVKKSTLEKVDNIAEEKEMERSELLRKIIENYIQTMNI